MILRLIKSGDLEATRLSPRPKSRHLVPVEAIDRMMKKLGRR